MVVILKIIGLTRILSWIVFVYLILLSSSAFAVGDDLFLSSETNNGCNGSLECAVEKFEAIEGDHVFYGLASYYNSLNYYVLNKDHITRIEDNSKTVLHKDEWLAVAGRFQVMIVKAPGLSFHFNKLKLHVDNQEILSSPGTLLKVVTKPDLFLIAPELDQIRYAHLWAPLAWLAKAVESSLIAINAHIISNWGIAIVVFSVLLKFLLLPVNVMTVSFQRRVSQVQAQLAPKLAEITANYDGEEAHNHLMAAHKELGVSPFYILKPMLGSFIQIPILIAVFNVLGEMPQLDGQSFLWIESLAYPDSIGHLLFHRPMFGDTISLLPFIMTVVTLYSTVIFQNSHAPVAEVKRQKRNLYLMAVVFFVLFYPFPAAMVLYWTLANILQTIQQQIIKI
jgi:YidC/Oxa1 family membrane protein insertase